MNFSKGEENQVEEVSIVWKQDFCVKIKSIDLHITKLKV